MHAWSVTCVSVYKAVVREASTLVFESPALGAGQYNISVQLDGMLSVPHQDAVPVTFTVRKDPFIETFDKKIHRAGEALYIRVSLTNRLATCDRSSSSSSPSWDL